MGSLLHRYRDILIISLLLLYALAQIFSLRLQNQHQLNPLERLLVNITSPPQQALTYLIDRTYQLWMDYLFLKDVRQNYLELSKRHRNQVLRLAQLEEERQENLRLRHLLGFQAQTQLQTVAARVISLGSSSFKHSVRIDKGERDGVRAGMAVVNSAGVVGHVLNTTAHYANVLLLVDPNSSIDVYDQNTRARGILQGQGTVRLRLEFVVRGEAMEIGSRLVSSGLDSIYPKGIAVGTIVEKRQDPASLFVDGYVEPTVKFARLEEVLVVIEGRRNQTAEQPANTTSEATP